jgi:hypothetical protein
MRAVGTGMPAIDYAVAVDGSHGGVDRANGGVDRANGSQRCRFVDGTVDWDGTRRRNSH